MSRALGRQQPPPKGSVLPGKGHPATTRGGGTGGPKPVSTQKLSRAHMTYKKNTPGGKPF